MALRPLPTETEAPDLDIRELDRLYDIVKSEVFLGPNSYFFGPLCSQLHHLWTEEISTAATNSIYLIWNPRWFLKLPPKTRVTILMHELWHVARMHHIGGADKVWKIWNYACDLRINKDLYDQGYSFEGVNLWLDINIDKSGRKSEEEIYDDLMKNYHDINELIDMIGNDPFGEDEDESDLHKELDENAIKQAVIIANITAKHQAELAGHGDHVPETVEYKLKQFLRPIIPWENLVRKWMQDLLDDAWTWARPNRRMLNQIYLPSSYEEDGRLEHLTYYLDVSGSITDPMIVRFNSEVKYLWDYYKPKKLTVVQFDTAIRWEKTFEEGVEFDEIEVNGRGGTDLAPVRAHMEKHKPTAAIIFTDLECDPMQPIDVPTLWVAINNTGQKVLFGDRVNIRG